MVGLVLLVILLVGAGVAVNVAQLSQRREQRRKQQLIRRLRSIDAKLAQDQRAAKRAMNDAAGQSWRNRFE